MNYGFDFAQLSHGGLYVAVTIPGATVDDRTLRPDLLAEIARAFAELLDLMDKLDADELQRIRQALSGQADMTDEGWAAA